MKKTKDETKEEKVVLKAKKKKKRTSYEKQRLIMKIAGYIMFVVMIVGTLLIIFAPLAYFK